MNALERICADKRQHVAARKAERSLPELRREAERATLPRGFAARLKEVGETGSFALICEMKRASPSGGLIRPDFDPAEIARAYEKGGAACLSVLTDAPYFRGEDADLAKARNACTLPVLRKDFMLDPYQVVESRALGADCILLIMAALGDGEAAELESLAMELGMDVLIEVHDAEELARALRLRSELIGINNRNLKTLKTDLETTEKLARDVPDERILVSESGIATAADLRRLAEAGAEAFLVGESLMRQADVTAATRALLNAPLAAAGA
jgi:indole-3-glycerol phosphate synthase